MQHGCLRCGYFNKPVTGNRSSAAGNLNHVNRCRKLPQINTCSCRARRQHTRTDYASGKVGYLYRQVLVCLLRVVAGNVQNMGGRVGV